jgi:hypothetical protein
VKTLRLSTLSAFLLAAPAAARAQEASSSPLVTDRPGITFSSLTVGRGVFQAELGLPSLTLTESGNSELRTTTASALVRYGLSDRFELRVGAPLYTETRVEVGRSHSSESGYGDLEVGAKWHLLDNQGSRPSFALIPSAILPTGQDGFSAEDPVYQLNAMAEWTLANGWGIGALGGYLNGPSGDDRYNQGTLAVAAGRSLPLPAWSAYGELAFVTTDLDGASDSAFAGAGVKYLATPNFQLDLSFDRGLTGDSPDWLFGFGVAARF